MFLVIELSVLDLFLDLFALMNFEHYKAFSKHWYFLDFITFCNSYIIFHFFVSSLISNLEPASTMNSFVYLACALSVSVAASVLAVGNAAPSSGVRCAHLAERLPTYRSCQTQLMAGSERVISLVARGDIMLALTASLVFDETFDSCKVLSLTYFHDLNFYLMIKITLWNWLNEYLLI